MKHLTFNRAFNFSLVMGLAPMSLVVYAQSPQLLSSSEKRVEACPSHFIFHNSQVTINIYNGIGSSEGKEVSSQTLTAPPKKTVVGKTVAGKKVSSRTAFAPSDCDDFPLAAWSGQSGTGLFCVIFDSKVYGNVWWVESYHCPGEAQPGDPNNAWREATRTPTPEEIKEHGNPTSCEQEPSPGSKLLIQDPSTLATYEQVGFKPDGSGTNISYTSARVAKPMYNQYQRDSAKPKLSAYITDWCQYDGRLTGTTNPEEAGRGFDLLNIDPTAYERLIFSFMGICGDPVESNPTLRGKIAENCEGAKFPNGHITVVDLWGDLSSIDNVGLPPPTLWEITPENFIEYYQQDIVKGLLGGLRELQKIPEEDDRPELAFSVGGWTMSGYFSEVAANEDLRQNFVESVVDFFERFPMFSAVDIDWEYPGGGGLEPGDPDDGNNYALLIGELRTALDKRFPTDRKEITIAASADVNKINESNINGLIEAGLDNIFLMTYDFFGSVWSDNLAHHTNLFPTNASPFSIDTAVDHLINTLKVSPSKIHLGYANYGRSAMDADIVSLKYKQGGDALGSFEMGAPEFYDVLFNYLDLEQGKAQGKRGFELMTDTVANADYLYSPNTHHHFISFDTPRTVKAKGKYVISKGLAGAFSWSADQDDGLLANAAREGMGYEITEQKFDMTTIYNEGTHFNLDLEQKRRFRAKKR